MGVGSDDLETKPVPRLKRPSLEVSADVGVNTGSGGAEETGASTISGSTLSHDGVTGAAVTGTGGGNANGVMGIGADTGAIVGDTDDPAATGTGSDVLIGLAEGSELNGAATPSGISS